MPSMLALAMPVALLLPFLGLGDDGANHARLTGAEASENPNPSSEKMGARPMSLSPSQFPGEMSAPLPLDALRDGQTVRQIRIEQRVIVRISPRRSRTRNEMLALQPRQSLNRRYEERKMEKCVPVSGISAVQTGSGNRLLLFMRDAGIISVNLEKACRARDFYAGFYVEKNADGQLCVDRDKLQSRSGAKCEVERMRQLVAVQD